MENKQKEKNGADGFFYVGTLLIGLSFTFGGFYTTFLEGTDNNWRGWGFFVMGIFLLFSAIHHLED